MRSFTRASGTRAVPDNRPVPGTVGRLLLVLPWLVLPWLLLPGLLIAEEPAAPTLGFMGPSSFMEKPNALVRTALACVLEDWSYRPPIGAWSVAVAAEGLRISGISLEGTDTLRALQEGEGFSDIELTRGPGNEGAVETVILPVASPLTLSQRQRFSLMYLDLEAAIPSAGQVTGAVRYVESLTASSGVVTTRVRVDGEDREPVLKEQRVWLEAEPACPVLNLGFSTENLRSDVPFEGIIGGEEGGGYVIVPVPEGEQGVVHIFANIVSGLEGSTRGVQGWSLSIAYDREIEVTRVTELGTAADKPPIGFYDGFLWAEIVDPIENGGQRGVVTGTVLDLFGPASLPPVGTYSVLDMTVEARGLPGNELFGVMRFWSGLAGQGMPVPNVLIVDGVSRSPCDPAAARIAIDFKKTGEGLFIRGNANDDQKLDIADPIWILNDLFLGGPATACLDAADANDDGSANISDPIYILNYQFLGGPAPPAPFPQCGLDPDLLEDGLGCGVDQTQCN